MRKAHTEFLEKFTAAQSSIRNILEKCRAISILVNNLRNTQNSVGSEIEQELQKKTVQVIKFTTATYYSTYCVDHVFTGLICHRNCGLDEVLFSGDPDKWTGDSAFTGCAAFSNNVCKECPGSKCGDTLHFHSYELPSKVDVPVVNMQDAIFAEYLKGWEDRDLIDNYKNAIVCMRDELLDQINDLFGKALQLKRKVYYFDFKKYIQSSLDATKLEMTASLLGGDEHDRLTQVCEIYTILIANIDQNDLTPLPSLNIPLIEGVLKLDKNNFMDGKLVDRLEDLGKNATGIANGIDEVSLPASFVKLYTKKYPNASLATSVQATKSVANRTRATKQTRAKKADPDDGTQPQAAKSVKQAKPKKVNKGTFRVNSKRVVRITPKRAAKK